MLLRQRLPDSNREHGSFYLMSTATVTEGMSCARNVVHSSIYLVSPVTVRGCISCAPSVVQRQLISNVNSNSNKNRNSKITINQSLADNGLQPLFSRQVVFPNDSTAVSVMVTGTVLT